MTNTIRRGALWVIEGGDGCGKSSQADLLRARLVGMGLDCWHTQEPWTSPHGVAIREMLRSGNAMSLDPVEMALLFAADRCVHVREIEARIARGGFVVTTRYIESSVVYQGAQLEMRGHALGLDWVCRVNEHFPVPDLTIVLDIPQEAAQQRLVGREENDGFDRDEAFQRIVTERYKHLEAYLPRHRIVHLNAAVSREVLEKRIWDVLSAECPELDR